MSHSAELTRRMARARIGAGRTGRRTDTFDRRQSPELERLPWESEGDRFPAVDWWLVSDGAVVVACLVAVALLILGVIP